MSSSKVVDRAETSDAADIPISEKKQYHVADEDVEDVVELSTAGPTVIDEMGFVEKRKSPSAGGTLDIDEMGLVEKRKSPNAGTLDIDEMSLVEKRKPQTAGTLDIDEMCLVEKKIPPTAGTLDIDKMSLVEKKIPPTAGTLLDIDEMGPPEKRKPFPTVSIPTVAISTPPSSVTCANTYFRVINVYMCEQHRSDVLMLGQPPTIMATLHKRKFRHMCIFDRLITTFLDDDNDDSNVLAFSQDPYWEQMGIDSCYPKTYDALSSVEFSMVMGYINYQYQIVYWKNKKSGGHDEFVNFVGSQPYLYYYHLWLCQVPQLLNFAVPLLPKSSFRESTDSAKSSSLSSKTVGSKKGRCSSTSSNHSSSMVQMANTLECFERVNAVKLQVLQSSAASRREKEILDVLDLYKSRLKDARKDLEELENHGYDSENSDVVQARLEIKICKRKRDHYIHLLSEGETSGD